MCCVMDPVLVTTESLCGRCKPMQARCQLCATITCGMLQVVTASRLLERAPSVAATLLMQHLLVAAGDQQQQLLGDFAAKRRQLEQQLEQHKHSLHPSMLHVNR